MPPLEASSPPREALWIRFKQVLTAFPHGLHFVPVSSYVAGQSGCMRLLCTPLSIENSEWRPLPSFDPVVAHIVNLMGI